MKKRNKWILTTIMSITLIIFITAIIALIWEYIMSNAKIILIISSSILIIFILIGLLTPKKIKNKFKKEFGL